MRRRFGMLERVYVEPPGEYQQLDVALFRHCIYVTTVPLWISQLGWALTAYAIWKALR